jgi:formimidoylglutamate deiminase
MADSAVDDTLLWAPRAWVGKRWCDAVLLRIGSDGCWSDVGTGVPAPDQALRLAGPVLPGMVNAHSHAFQRAFAGLSERRENQHDDFWSWRDRMYRVALRITPAQLRAVAAQLYAELLRGGYTQVCEFHYLQHQPDGQPYADPLTLSWALADAAAQAGIGLTLLPVLYQRAGFDQPTLRDDQRRFATDARSVLDLHSALRGSGRPNLKAGVAIHSLRAAEPAAITQLADAAGDVPIHIHVAEQTAEVDACLAAHGQRPIEWLAAHAALDARWQLVHATHSTPAEIDAVARSGAGVVLCPSTEANLGDGLADLPGWLKAGVPLAIGSDSHATRAWREELRWLEYGQRLQLRQRNISAAPAEGQASTAQRLLSRTLDGGGRAAGFKRWGLEVGARADLLVIDTEDASLLGVPDAQTLDALVFSSPGRPFRDVLVAGRWAVREHRQAAGHGMAARFMQAMHLLWAEA